MEDNKTKEINKRGKRETERERERERGRESERERETWIKESEEEIL